MSAWVAPEGTWAVRPEDVAVLDDAAQEPYNPLLTSTSKLVTAPRNICTAPKAPISTVPGRHGRVDDKTGVVLELRFNTSYDIVSVPTKLGRDGQGTASSVTNDARNGCVVDAVTFAGGPVWCADFCPPPRGVPLHAFATVSSIDAIANNIAATTTSPSAANTKTLSPVAAAATELEAPACIGAGDASATLGSKARVTNPASLGPAVVEYVAVGAHPPGNGTNLTNVALRGPGAVQLWALPHGEAAPECPMGLPRCAMLLVHDGRVTWDVRWCKSPGCIFQQQQQPPRHTVQGCDQPAPPGRSTDGSGGITSGDSVSGGGRCNGVDAGHLPAGSAAGGGPGAAAAGGWAQSLPVLGLLAIVIGDGSVIVAAVPEPSALAAGGSGRKSAPGFTTREDAAMATAMESISPVDDREGKEDADDGCDGGDGPAPMEVVDGRGCATAAAASGKDGDGVAADTDATAADVSERPPLRGKSPGPPPPLVRLVRPAVLLRREQMGGALASCCDWHMPDPRVGPPQLLVGCWDGSVALWRLPRGGSTGIVERTQLLFHIPADVLPLRRVISNPIWDTDFLLPAGPSTDTHEVHAEARVRTAGGGLGRGGGTGASTSSAAVHNHGIAAAKAAAAMGCGLGGRIGAPGGPAGHLFCTTGYTGRVKIWDDRDASRPLLDRIVHRSYVHDAAWTRRPAALTLAQDDGGLRVVLLDAAAAMSGGEGNAGVGSLTFREPNCSALWSTYYVPRLHMLLYGGTEGVVAAVPWEFPADTRNRRPHVPLAGLVRDGPRLRLLSPDEVSGVQLFYPGGFNWRGIEGSSVPRLAPSYQTPNISCTWCGRVTACHRPLGCCS
ncbi:hypothetical protein Vretimale_16874 [Volvox reticuliferus]|uniref:Uncharacterized protein n=1 Tax=Volvox reticuliferus TaxID=1737510 RepID=A0A8J4GTM7_9CHLO|nr:hypothetical protein Vretimale_16874 [Volvox reticuliferus]